MIVKTTNNKIIQEWWMRRDLQPVQQSLDILARSTLTTTTAQPYRTRFSNTPSFIINYEYSDILK